jgi:hypothetical protein
LQIAQENIELYNDKLSPLMDNQQTPKRNMCNISISEDWKFMYYNSDPKSEKYFDGILHQSQPITNYDLAKYCGVFVDYYLSEIHKSGPAGIEKSFSWKGTPDQLKKLFDGLINAPHSFIDPKTDFKDFTAIFSDNLTNCTAIKWSASNKLLSYLFDQLYAGNFIVKEWQSIIEKYNLFQNKAGKYLTAQDLASALNSINDPFHGLNPRGYEKIDIILKNLKTG